MSVLYGRYLMDRIDFGVYMMYVSMGIWPNTFVTPGSDPGSCSAKIKRPILAQERWTTAFKVFLYGHLACGLRPWARWFYYFDSVTRRTDWALDRASRLLGRTSSLRKYKPLAPLPSSGDADQ